MLRRNHQQTHLPGRFLVGALTLSACVVLTCAVSVHSAGDHADTKAKADEHGDPLPPGALARMGTLRWRHGEVITFVAFSKDGKGVITASQDKMMRLWERESGKELYRINVDAVIPVPPTTSPSFIMRNRTAPALSHDGKVLAGFNGNAIQLWDAASGKELRQFKGPPAGIRSILFSPDDKTLAVRGGDQAIYLLEVKAGKEIRQIRIVQQPGAVFFGVGGVGGAIGLAFSPDGTTLASTEMEFTQQKNDIYVKISDVNTGKEIRRIVPPAAAGVTCVAYSPNGKVLAYGTSAALHLVGADTGKEIRQIKAPDTVLAVAFSPNGEMIAIKERGQVIRLFETATGKAKQELGEPPGPDVNVLIGANAEVCDFAFSADGTIIASGGGQTARMWHTDTGKEIPTIDGPRKSVSAILPTPDGKILLSWGEDKTLRRWDTLNGNELDQFRPKEIGTSSAFAPDGRTVALEGMDGTIRIHATATGQEIHRLKGHAQGCAVIAFSPTGKVLASRGNIDGTIRLYNPAKGNELKQITLPAYTPAADGDMLARNAYAGIVNTLAFSPDGQTIAAHVPRSPAAPGGTLLMWDVTTGKEIRKIILPAGPGINQITFAPDGRILATENNDQTISRWELAGGRERARFGTPASGGGAGSVFIGMVGRTGSFPLITHATHTLAYSPDGALLAMANADHSVHVWDISAGKEIGQFKGHTGAISAIAFAADGKTLISGSRDTTILVWDLPSLKREPRPAPAELEVKEGEALWTELAGDDAAQAYRSLLRLATAPKQSAAFLSDRLPPAVTVDSKTIEQLITDLGSGNFKTRARASEGLAELGDLAVPSLKKALTSRVPLETLRRMESLLEKITAGVLTAEQLRVMRAVELLERLGTSESRQVLDTLSKGAPGAFRTRQAQAVLDRLSRQTTSLR
jgi:WD40 repeat protein